LVVYATRGGATARLARSIAERLRDVGVEADVSRVDYVRRLHRYDAVIVGSPLIGKDWQEDAIDFLGKNKRLLRGRSVWLFHLCPFAGRETVQLPTEVLRLSDRIGVIGVLTFVMRPNGRAVNGDGSFDDKVDGGEITNIEAIDQLAHLVAGHAQRHRRAI
jgi:flavodoxin